MGQAELGMTFRDEEVVEGEWVLGAHAEGLAVVVDGAGHVALREIWSAHLTW